MTALTAPFTNPIGAIGTGAIPLKYSYPIADNVKIYPGALIAMDSNGRVKPAVTATGLVILGQYRGTSILDNTVTGHTAGAFQVNDIYPGVSFWTNSGTDAATVPGVLCYAEDDNTVGVTATGKSIAGVVHSVSASPAGVFVYTPGLTTPFL